MAWTQETLFELPAKMERHEQLFRSPDDAYEVRVTVAFHPDSHEARWAVEARRFDGAPIMWHMLDRFGYADAGDLNRRLAEPFAMLKAEIHDLNEPF